MIVHGDCIEAMREMDEASVDAVVTDPPYGLGFMGKDWDSAAALGSRPPSADEIDARFRNVFPRTGKGPTATAFDGRAFQTWCETWATEALRVLKPGGHMLAAGSSRTFHRLVCAIEDAGFEVRDTITHHYGSGFPKSLDVGKAIDKAAGVEREVTGPNPHWRPAQETRPAWLGDDPAKKQSHPPLTAPATPEAEQWQGWGTALKPATEFWCVARKPLVGTVARNVLEHGTGAINVDATRVGTAEALGRFNNAKPAAHRVPDSHADAKNLGRMQSEAAWVDNSTGKGRWPPNAVFSHADGCQQVGTRRVKSDGHFAKERKSLGTHGIYSKSAGWTQAERNMADPDGTEEVEAWTCAEDCPVAELDRQSGELHAQDPRTRRSRSKATGVTAMGTGASVEYADKGTAARFFPTFRYQAKSSRAERNAGLEHLPKVQGGSMSGGEETRPDRPTNHPVRANHHPCVKPLALMRWLVRLVTPPGGQVLDPFAGSGSTGCACALEGFDFVGIEREAEYVEIARARIAHWQRVKDSEPLTL